MLWMIFKKEVWLALALYFAALVCAANAEQPAREVYTITVTCWSNPDGSETYTLSSKQAKADAPPLTSAKIIRAAKWVIEHETPPVAGIRRHPDLLEWPKCAECNGHGAYWLNTSGLRGLRMRCNKCGGSGEISDADKILINQVLQAKK